jgi:Na+-driven multidrug efflux pump
MWIQRLHFGIGILTLLVFFASGLYMQLQFPGLYADNEIVRYQYRANHIYLLAAALINIVLGAYLQASKRRWRHYTQSLGRLLLLAAPVWLVCAFLLEPPQASPERILTFWGIVSMLAGTLLHLRLPQE